MSEKKTRRPVKELLAKATRPQRIVTVNTNGALLSEQQRLEMELAQIQEKDSARLAHPPAAIRIAKRIQQIEIDSEDFLVDLTLEALPSPEWRNRIAQFPPTDDQKKDGYIVNLDGMAQAVLATSCVDPVLDQDDVANIMALSEGQWRMIANALWQVNGGDNAVPFSQISSLYLPTSDDESKSPDPGEFPSDDSKDGNPANGSPSKTATKRAGRLAG